MFWVLGLGFRVQVFGFSVQGLGLRVWGSGLRAYIGSNSRTPETASDVSCRDLHGTTSLISKFLYMSCDLKRCYTGDHVREYYRASSGGY